MSVPLSPAKKLGGRVIISYSERRKRTNIMSKETTARIGIRFFVLKLCGNESFWNNVVMN